MPIAFALVFFITGAEKIFSHAYMPAHVSRARIQQNIDQCERADLWGQDCLDYWDIRMQREIQDARIQASGIEPSNSGLISKR